MTRSALVFFVILGMLSLQGCSEHYKKLEQRINGLDQWVEGQQHKSTEFQMGVQRQFSQLLNKVVSLESYVYRDDTIMISPEEKKFKKINTAVGYFLVACESAIPAENGYKLNLVVGNPSAVTYNGFVLRVVWGKKFEGGSVAQFEEWKGSLREKERLFASNILKPGGWSKVEVPLVPAGEEDLGFIQVSMGTGEVTFGDPEAQEKPRQNQ